MKTSNNRSKRFIPNMNFKLRIKFIKFKKKKSKKKKKNFGIQGINFKPKILIKEEQAEHRKSL